MLKIQIGPVALQASLAQTAAARALEAMLASGPVQVPVENYGGFEKVGQLPQRLPQTDDWLTAQPGDILLFQGDSIVLSYGANAWDYTRLGRIEDPAGARLAEVLRGPEREITLSLC